MSGLSGSWRVLRAARSGGTPWSWLSQRPPLPTWAWKEGLRAPANPSQEAPSISGPLQGSVYTGKGLLSGPCRPSGSGPLGTPSTPGMLPGSPHVLCLEEPPICILPLGQRSKAAPAQRGVEAALSPLFPSHLLSLPT